MLQSSFSTPLLPEVLEAGANIFNRTSSVEHVDAPWCSSGGEGAGRAGEGGGGARG